MYYQVSALVGFASNGEEGNGRMRKKKKTSNDKISSKLKKKRVGGGARRPCHIFFKVRKMEMEMQREWAWNLISGEFVTVVQRMRVQCLDYLHLGTSPCGPPSTAVRLGWRASWKALHGILSYKFIHIASVERRCPVKLGQQRFSKLKEDWFSCFSLRAARRN